ncbi:MAG: 50S ribosomal protein L3 N(5)-glutamine methyltransferase [Magnetococcales bacterium]|nr:50S ribosomal protein L3 N(5)-glutamine methyltransferase [Magnetococcales bacterium]
MSASHSSGHPRASTRSSDPQTVSHLIEETTRRLEQAGLNHDNGLQTAAFEAEYLVAHAAELPFETIEQHEGEPVTPAIRTHLETMLQQRIDARQPVPYITGEAFFAGFRFLVNNRTLIPRSRLENIFDDPEGFDGLLPMGDVHTALDLCTGNGCIGLTLALTYPHLTVDATDISREALAVAERNRKRLKLTEQVALLPSDLFSDLTERRYDLILTNPPYVADATYDALPPEYHAEPEIALRAGSDGLDIVDIILKIAPDHMTQNALMLCEVGDEGEQFMKQRWPDFPGEWIHFHFGTSGVFAIQRKELSIWNRSRGLEV